jgi:hypothetical protein
MRCRYRWETGRTTRAETHCGCFLPDLTGLARRPSAADLPRLHIMLFGGGDKAGSGRSYPFTAPAVSAPTMKRCSTMNVSIAGSADRMAAAASRCVLTESLLDW